MQLTEKTEKRWLYLEGALFAGFFLAAFLLCGQISYSDGDDAYFYQMAHSMPLFDYLKMRYVGWEGRMTSEAMTYAAFYLGKSFWQPVNAFVLTLLPYGLIRIVKNMSGALNARRSFLLSLAVYLGILSLGISVIGYGAFWVTGSTFYLWSIVAGLWAAMPFADLVYRKDKGERTFLYAMPCAFLAAMGQEQIAAVVIVFGGLAVLYEVWRERRIPWLHTLEVILMIVSLVLLLVSPGTEARSQAEIEQWMPMYDTMSLGNHIFITVQWMLSSFANQGKMLFFLIWILGIWLLFREKPGEGSRKRRLLAGVSAVFAVVSLLPYMGVTLFSEMGMGVPDITQCVLKVATPASLSGQNWFALIWWLGAVVFTVVLVWQIEAELKHRTMAALLILAACASEAIMFFSPTMYASGDRVFFVAQILLWLLIGRLCGKLLDEEPVWLRDWLVVILVGIAGALNTLSGISTVMMYL